MPISESLLAILHAAGGYAVVRTVGKAVNAIGERIVPYESTRAYKQTEQSYARQREIELMREQSQAEQNRQSQQFQAEQNRQSQQFQAEQNRQQQLVNIGLHKFNRQTNLLLAQRGAYTALRHTLIQDTIRDFPLNISPLVLLENNGIDISFLLGKDQNKMDNKALDKKVIDLHDSDAPKPLSVFITPMHIDSRVGGKEILAAQVFDFVYSSLESVFINEYSRNGERPVIFYSAAWKKDVKGGLHAAEELSYFLKGMPTVVVEPRFDGKTIKLIFSCWGIGYSSQIHSRQELSIPLDLNSMVAISAYERSKKVIDTFKGVECSHKVVKEQKEWAEHNVQIFEELRLADRIEKRFKEIQKTGKSTELDEVDYSNLMYISPSDLQTIADTIAATAGIMISVLSDTHHLLANDIQPRFPDIYKTYFADYVNEDLLKQIANMYERTYLRLSREFPEQESLRLVQKEAVRKRLGNGGDGKNRETEETIRYALKQRCINLGAQKKDVGQWDINKLIDFYLDNYDGDDVFSDGLSPFLSREQKSLLNTKKLKYI